MTTPAYLGLMSGTSMDGIDAVLASFDQGRVHIHASHTVGYPDQLRHRLQRASQNIGTPDDLGALDHEIGHLFAQAASGVLAKADTAELDILAIGSHGQTVRHHPRGQTPFSLQLGDPNLITERTCITTIADFRRRDMAAGGEGAPLVPAFHQAFFGSTEQDRCIVNIGGIANITRLGRTVEQPVLGFDTGPGNALMDAWCQHQTGKCFDENGQWAAEGCVNQALLSDMLSDAYFSQKAPKSTGKEKFNLDWIKTVINRHPEVCPTDVQRTLLELTVVSIAREMPPANGIKIYVCGGGVRNKALMQELRKACSPISVCSTDELGIDPQWVEATAFAWLAKQTLDRRPGNLPAATGAQGPRILGAIYLP
ncbi:MAG: anhydro-N-acetylmuramic acid kinase [Marinobacter sp.]|uniref:anhydro-N-acetylmuramic acid kinase n=1 Tax=Marinobacter sp. TaxID=50741 RepID=UPI00299EF843|nr:anhydro-N-acetylmuramic acid kinase [Marinobacter sp.]MDX1757606.1 anhydro-N-acetylmuramic acid kinase [Marinobacter sp.]